MKKSKFTFILSPRRILVAAFGVAWLAVCATGSYAQPISVNFVNGGSGIDNGETDSMLPADTAGPFPYTQANWNNLGRYGSGSFVLTNSAGATAPVTMQWDATGTSSSGTTSLGTGDGKLMDGFLYSYSPGQATDPLGNSVYNSTVNVKPLIYARGLNSYYTSLGAEGYSVVLYINGYNYYGQAERWIQSVSGDPLANTMVAGADLTPHLFSADTTVFNGTYVQVPATATNAASTYYGGANYEVLTGLTNDAALIRLSADGNYGANAINGFQIVPIFPSLPTATTPTFTPSSTVFAGVPVTLTEVANGDPFHPALYYQWQSDNMSGGPATNSIPNATNATLSVTPINQAAAYNIQYQVVVSNIFGVVTSSVVTLTVNPAVAPYLTQDTTPGPTTGATNVYAYINGSVSFSAAFAGTLPITNNWQANTNGSYANIPNATNNSVTLTNIQSTSAGTYQLLAINGFGSSNSTPATLIPLADPPALNASEPYAYAVLTNNPVAYWRLNETLNNQTNSVQAYDYSGHNLNATYGFQVYDDQPGPASPSQPGFEANNTAAAFINNIAGSHMTAPSLNLNTNTVTITAWINPSSVVGTYWGLFTWFNGSDKAGFGFGSTLNGSSVAELGYTWNTNSAATYNYNSGLYPVAGQWSFVALVITPTNSTIYLYTVNGGTPVLAKSVQAIANGPESFSGGNIFIGSDTYDGRDFLGSIGEVAVFNKSLGESQIQNLYLIAIGATGVAPTIISDPAPAALTTYVGQSFQLTASASGAPVPYYQWQYRPGGTGVGSFVNVVNGGGISGANSPTLVVNGATPADSTDYQLVVTNIAGTATSGTATVTLAPVPTNGQWTANFAVVNGANGTSLMPYSGNGILGSGTYWNALSIPGGGGGFETTSTVYQDNGTTINSITVNSTLYNDGYANGSGTGTIGLFGPYAEVNGNNLQFANIPNGTYNLALYGVDGNYQDQGDVFTVNGVVQTTTGGPINVFIPGVNSVLYTNVLVAGGALNVTCSNNIVANPSQGSGAFNGAQLQLVQAAGNPSGISSVKVSGGNLVIAGTSPDSGESYRILATTNLTLPLTSWVPVTTNTFSSNGFSNTIPVNAANPQQFYRVVEP